MLLFQLFEYLGFNLNKFDESNPIVYVFVGFLFLACLCFLGVLNVSFYLLSMPVFTILFFIFTLANTGIPLSLNFLGEQLSLIGIWNKSPIIAAIGATGIVFSACYSIYLYNRLSYGLYSPHLKPVQDITRLEFNLLIALLIPTILLGIFPNVILDSLHLSVSSLLYNIPFL